VERGGWDTNGPFQCACVQQTSCDASKGALSKHLRKFMVLVCMRACMRACSMRACVRALTALPPQSEQRWAGAAGPWPLLARALAPLAAQGEEKEG